MNKNAKLICKSCLVFLLSGLISLFSVAQHLPFQGKLLENGQPVNGTKSFTFSINQGVVNWSETHPNLPVNNGLYAVVLGSITPLPTNLFAAQTALNLKVFVGGVPLDIVPIYPPIEADPNVPANLKDGVSWNEISSIPTSIYRDTSAINELQNLALNNKTLSITSGNSVVLPEISLPPEIQYEEPDTIYQVCPAQVISSANQEISSIWQSFKACYRGMLDTICVQFANINSTGIKLRIYPGEGISGQVLYEENFITNLFPALLQMQKIGLSNDFGLTEGTKYTFQITGISAAIYASYGNNAYADGYSNFGADKDLKFQIKNKIFVPFQFTVNGTVTANQYLGVDCIPQGLIVMWSGAIANIPTGWSLCDGSNDTPDLRDRFIVGAKQDDNGVSKTNVSGTLTQTGGEVSHTLTINEMPSHTHTNNAQNANGWASGNYVQGSNNGGSPPAPTTVTSNSTGAGQPHNNLPPYYALAFIMKL